MGRPGSRARAAARALGLALPLLAAAAAARNGSDPLNYYGLATLPDPGVAGRLAARFKSGGQPLFLIHDLDVGLSQGDIMRFPDRAILVDANVWQTLQDEGALQSLKGAPVVRARAKANGAAWEARAKLVTAPREKKAYQLGAELLKVLEADFGGAPESGRMVVEVEGGNLVLLAPAELLDGLRFNPVVRKEAGKGAPRFVSPPPEGWRFTGQPFFWQAWAVDPADPSATLAYSLSGPLPRGLEWDAQLHALRGRPEQAGTGKVRLQVRDRAGASDTLSVTLRLREDAPPRLAGEPKSPLVAGQPWSFAAEGVDPDHAGDELRCRPLDMPAGMAYDSLSRTFTWTPSDADIGRPRALALRLSDPLGAHTDSRFELKVIAPGQVLATEGVRLDLPWDTLRQGRAYRWEEGAQAELWAQRGIRLAAVEGPDSTQYADHVLRLVPMAAGEHALRFRFDIRGQERTETLRLPVAPDRPPYFASEPGVWRLRTRQSAAYRPVALDPDGDSVWMEALLPPGSPLAWDGKRLSLRADKPGIYQAEFLAWDPAGHSARQRIAYTVTPASRPPSWVVENRREAGLSLWSAAVDFGTGRIGLYTPDLPATFRGRDPGVYAWPYLYFGGNLHGPEQERRGNRLLAEAGLTARAPDPKLATGGVYGRLRGEWTPRSGAFSRVELEILGHIKQAIILADTSGLELQYANRILEFGDRYQGVLRKLVSDATAKDNAAIFTRLEAWTDVYGGLQAGPGTWREDFPMARHFWQFTGGGFRYGFGLGGSRLVNSLRAGWGPGRAGWSVNWNAELSLRRAVPGGE